MRFPFLTAGWSNICIVTYCVASDIMASFLPPGLQPDTCNEQAFASLVGLTFLDTRVLAVGWPGFRCFPELNLRVYVRKGQTRGVLFIRELVPSPVVAWLARTLYNEPYEAGPLTVHVEDSKSTLSVQYVLERSGQRQKISVVGGKPAAIPAGDSLEHFLKEHRWGFGMDRRRRLLSYEVEHPTWAIYPIKSFDISFDWGKVYGPTWEFLSDVQPVSIMLAAGSQITVFSPTGGNSSRGAAP